MTFPRLVKSFVVCIPIQCDSEHGVRMFMSRVRSALSSENVLSDDALSKLFIAEMNWRLETELELSSLSDNN